MEEFEVRFAVTRGKGGGEGFGEDVAPWEFKSDVAGELELLGPPGLGWGGLSA